MFVDKKKMTMTEKILYILAFSILIGLFIYLGTQDFEKVDKESKNFHREYNLVPETNVFKYVYAKDVLSILEEKKDAVIFFAFPENEWANIYAKLIQEAAASVGLKEVLYYNFYSDRAGNHTNYEKILTYLNNYLTVDDHKNKEIYSPTLVMISKGEIIYFDDETSLTKAKDNIEDYWTSDKQYTKKLDFSGKMVQFAETEQTNSKNESKANDKIAYYPTILIKNAEMKS